MHGNESRQKTVKTEKRYKSFKAEEVEVSQKNKVKERSQARRTSAKRLWLEV